MSTVSQVLVVYMYSSGLLGTHAFEMPLEKHDLFSLVGQPPSPLARSTKEPS